MKNLRIVSNLILLFAIVQPNGMVNTVNSDWERIEHQTIAHLNPNATSFAPKDWNKSSKGKKKKRTNKANNKRRKAKGGTIFKEEAAIYSQNVHGLFESKKDEQNKPIGQENSPQAGIHSEQDEKR